MHGIQKDQAIDQLDQTNDQPMDRIIDQTSKTLDQLDQTLDILWLSFMHMINNRLFYIFA